MKKLMLLLCLVISLACGSGGGGGDSVQLVEDELIEISINGESELSSSQKPTVDILFFIHNEIDPVAPYDGEIFVIHNRDDSQLIPAGSYFRIFGVSEGRINSNNYTSPDFDEYHSLVDDLLPSGNFVWRLPPLGDSIYRPRIWFQIDDEDIEVFDKRGIDPDDETQIRSPYWGNTYDTWPDWYTYDGNSQ